MLAPLLRPTALGLAAALCAGVCLAAPVGPLRVGIASADITPQGAVWMAGFGARKKPSEGVYKPLRATCVVFDNGAARLAIVAMDLCKIGQAQRADLIAAAREAGIPENMLLINVSHTHCGPSMNPKNAEYLALLKERTGALLARAAADLQPARLEYAVGSCTMAVNRRQKGPDGKILFRPEPRKPIDPDVPVLRIVGPENATLAVLFGYACHPTTIHVTKEEGYRIGPDYPGFARDWIEAAWPGATAVFLQGCGADIKPRYTTPEGRFGYVLLKPVETAAEIGHELGRAVVAALAVPRDAVPKHIEAASDSPGAGARPVALGGILEKLELPPRQESKAAPTIYLGAWRIGDLYLVGSQCEIGSRIGMRIKRELGAQRVWTNGYCHWGGGYLMEAAAHEEGGYEVKHSAVAPEGEEVLVGAALRQVRALREDSR